MFFKKKREQRINEMANIIRNILPKGATLLSFEYNSTIFGKMVVEVKALDDKHTFITDRGEIYHNGIMLCDSSYHYYEKEDTFSKLLQIIQKVFSE